MAKFKRKTSRVGRRMAKRSRGSSKGSENPLMLIIPALAYGAGRGYLSNAIKPLTDKIPLGNYADEAVFGTVGYFMAKKGKGMVKSAGKAILIVEAASLGSQLMGSVADSTQGTANNYGNNDY
jgi:hypothetical protein